VRDLDKAIAFYTDVLGMRLASRTKVAETKGEFAIVRSTESDHYLEINWYDGQVYNSGDELDHIAFEVDDLTAALSELAKKRGFPGIVRSGIYELALDLHHRPERNLDRTL
jgi:lactoylglutathione lyase